MDEQLFGTFKKIERQLEEKKQTEIRDAENRRLEAARAIIEARRRKQALIVYSSLFLFVSSVVFLAYSFRSEINIQTVRISDWLTSHSGSEIGSAEQIAECKIPKNYGLKACARLRQSESDARWQSIRVIKSKPFGITKEHRK